MRKYTYINLYIYVAHCLQGKKDIFIKRHHYKDSLTRFLTCGFFFSTKLLLQSPNRVTLKQVCLLSNIHGASVYSIPIPHELIH